MRTIFILLAAVVLSVSAYAGNSNNDKNTKESGEVTKTEKTVAFLQIKGNVMDKKSNETLAGASIYVDGKRIYSDLDGNFVLTNIAPGKHNLKVELISYETTEMKLDVQRNSEVNIHLVQK